MRILWVVPYHFEPPISGGRIRLRHAIDAVLEAGHEIELWVLGEDPSGTSPRSGLVIRYFEGRSKTRAYQQAHSVIARLPNWAWISNTPEVRRAFRSRVESGLDLVVLDELHTGFLASEAIGPPVVAQFHNVESRAQRDLADSSRSVLRRLRLRQDSRKLRRLERRVIRRADLIVTVSEEDAAVLRAMGVVEPVVARNGVDSFRYRDVWHDPAEVKAIAMTAQFGYAPNSAGAHWLVELVMPLVWRDLPDLEIWLVGAEPPEWMLTASASDPRIVVTGQVDDVRPFLAQVSAAVVPLLSGGGTSLKVAEALALGLPIISTPAGARGYSLQGLAQIEADPQAFAAAVVSALRAPGDEALVRRRQQVAEMELDWRVTLRPFTSAIAKLV